MKEAPTINKTALFFILLKQFALNKVLERKNFKRQNQMWPLEIPVMMNAINDRRYSGLNHKLISRSFDRNRTLSCTKTDDYQAPIQSQLFNYQEENIYSPIFVILLRCTK